ncbi:DUF6216 family protein [Rahnella sp. CFA14(1/10)]|uniref:DUF6216 family protein n=1 Tax=Rahnella sp. CFA14(1/10) TaxID=2511203 RepID=UPI0010229EA5|nr:DUF6216 family protein [Rahnella sp. CFA14(1/10)]
MEELGSSILKYHDIIKEILYVAVAFIVVWYFYLRAGSSYSMMSRLWGILIGSKGFKNNEISELMQEREDIDKFNFIFNVKATSIEQIKRLQKRVKKQNLDIKLISRSKGHFYINTCKLKVPKEKQIFGTLLLSAVLFFCTLPVLQLAIKPAAMFEFNDSSTWFWVNNQYAEKYIPPIPIVSSFFDYWRFDNDTCTSKNFSVEKLSATTKLTNKEITAICELFKGGKTPYVIEKAITGQKVAYFLSLFPLFFSLICFRGFIYMLYTYDLRYALLKKKGKIKPRHKTKYVGS